MRVTVRVPATIANLGPGFDCMGLAIAWHTRVTLRIAEKTSVTVTGPGEDRIPTDESNLVVRSIRAWEEAVDASRGAYEATIANNAPYGRGFGSSAAAIVGGLVAAREILDGDANVLMLAGMIEGHLDNVSAALMGGITISGYAPDDALRIEPPPELRVLACVAKDRLSTSTARGALPEQVSFKDAVGNAARAALLAASLAGEAPTRLLAATQDLLHQDRRFALIPATATLVNALRAEGIAAFLSGAGPSVAALLPGDEAAEAYDAAVAAAPDGWHIELVAFDRLGAVVEDE